MSWPSGSARASRHRRRSPRLAERAGHPPLSAPPHHATARHGPRAAGAPAAGRRAHRSPRRGSAPREAARSVARTAFHRHPASAPVEGRRGGKPRASRSTRWAWRRSPSTGWRRPKSRYPGIALRSCEEYAHPGFPADPPLPPPGGGPLSFCLQTVRHWMPRPRSPFSVQLMQRGPPPGGGRQRGYLFKGEPPVRSQLTALTSFAPAGGLARS